MKEAKRRTLSPFMTAERSECVRKAARLLRTSPMFIADLYGASPDRIETLLRYRWQWDDNLSIRENVKCHYGARAVAAIEAAI